MEKRGEENSIANKLILKKAVDHRIRQVLDKAFISEKEVYNIIRGFFKKYVNIDYEFTSEELMKELRKVYLSPGLQERVCLLLTRVSEMEHLSREFQRKELEDMLREFRAIVDEMIVSHYESKSFLHKVRDLLHRAVSKEHKNALEPKEQELLSQTEQQVVKMNILLDDTNRWSKKDINEAKKAYKELLSIYNGLDEEKQKAYFEPVNQLFQILKSKER